ncbi:hypothetical protein [Shimia sp. SDUM112013]|uniref:hypothetical protein n=1 Tax=Shimia sp. SDUM112013 TaxID=3136160 RepID=UPI0032ED06A8
MKRLLVLVFMCLPALAKADMLPALFDVTGVAANDTLNIRSAPDANAQRIGELGPDAKNVEVVGLGPNGKWAMIGLPEATGWVSLRFLERVSETNWIQDEIPLACFGTEPFWSVGVDGDRQVLTHRHFDAEEEAFDITWVAAPDAGMSGTMGLYATGYGSDVFTNISSAQCSDGMSDRTFGLSIALYIMTNEQTVGYKGCCALVAR